MAYFTGRAVRLDEDLLEASLDAGAVDLSLVRSGRCPLLAEHRCRLENLLGQVIAVEVDGPIMRAIVQFAHGPEPDRLWAMLQAGFPLSLSIGGSIQHAEVAEELPGSRRLYKVLQWSSPSCRYALRQGSRRLCARFAHRRRCSADDPPDAGGQRPAPGSGACRPPPGQMGSLGDSRRSTHGREARRR